MSEDFQFYLEPDLPDLERFSTQVEAITVTRADGTSVEVDPRPETVKLSGEHPEVERMEGDLGAICEVFKKSRDYYLRVSGVQLAAGDTVVLRRRTWPSMVVLKVLEIEGQRARTGPPEIRP